MNGTDYNRIAELWERLGTLADKADGLHMKIYRAALFGVMDADRADRADGEYRGKCRLLLDDIAHIERQGEIECVTAGDTGTAGNLRRQLCALRNAVNTLVDYPGEEEARKPGPTGQELIDEAWERYFDEESSRGFPCDKALEARLEREIEAIHHRPGWGVFAPEIMHDNLILVLGRLRLECRKGEAEARKHIWAKLDGIAGGVDFLRDSEERKIRRRSKTAKATPRRGVDDQMTDAQWNKFLPGLAKKLEADKRKAPEQREGQQTIIENAIKAHNDASESKITIGWQGVKKRLQRWKKRPRRAH